MKALFTNRFEKELKKLDDAKLALSVKNIIDNMKEADTINDVKNLKKIRGRKSAYRIKIKDYRIGLFIEGDTVEFARFLHRKDICKYFP